VRSTHRYGRLVCLLALFFGLAVARVAGSAPQADELGAVRWARSLDVALAESGSSGRPVFALFQEVPGCQTCVSFGEQVLSNPLLVEAIEDEFVPLAIYNNRAGADRAALERYGEPAWNNPVVRFLGSEGADLIPRRQGVWAPGQVAERMIAALEASARPVPSYLREAAYELRDRLPGRAVVATHCYWEGEGCIGRLEGVVATRAVWLEGREAVEVTFDRERTDYAKLLRSVQQAGCAHAVFAAREGERAAAEAVFGDAVILSTAQPRPAGDSDQKRHLRHSPLGDLALSELQAVRVNGALWARQDPAAWLTPRQRARRVAP